jgi:hypothetical protein
MLYCMDACFIGETMLENLPRPAVVGATRVGGVNYNQARIRTVIEAVVTLATSPAGFSASQVSAEVRARSGQPESDYSPRQAAYDIKKLRGKGLIQKCGNSRRYAAIPEGLRAMAALVDTARQSDSTSTRRQRQIDRSTEVTKPDPNRSTR